MTDFTFSCGYFKLVWTWNEIACSSKFEPLDRTQCVPNGIIYQLKVFLADSKDFAVFWQLKNLQNSQENLRKRTEIHSLLPTVYSFYTGIFNVFTKGSLDFKVSTLNFRVCNTDDSLERSHLKPCLSHFWIAVLQFARWISMALRSKKSLAILLVLL